MLSFDDLVAQARTVGNEYLQAFFALFLVLVEKFVV